VTSAAFPPVWIRSLVFFALRDLRLVSPRAKRTISRTFDFPDPFGPAKHKKVLGKVMSINLKDLKFLAFKREIKIIDAPDISAKPKWS
jgi:hypothetical protein